MFSYDILNWDIMPKCNIFSSYLLSESPLEVRPPSLLGGIYAAGRTSPRFGPRGRTSHAAALSGGGTGRRYGDG